MRFTFLLGVFLLNLQLVFSSTFTVKNTNDSGAGSLREAVDLSNNEKGLSKIDFLIDENPTITLQTPLSISSCVEIDGATSAGNIVIQGPQDACAISCVNVASGDSIVLKNIEIGISADKSNVGQIELHEITGESSATFICDGVKMAFELKRGAHVKTFDYAWIIKMNDTEVANSFQGVVYGKELYLSNKTYFHDCRNVLTFFSSTSTTCSNIEIKDCKFSDNTGNISVSGDVTQIRKCEFINNKSSIFLASRPKSIINIDSCIFEKSQGIAIRSSNLIDGWTVKIENNRFYDSESNNNYLVALEKRYSDNVVLSPSKLTFKNNYFGINGEGESSNVNKAFYVQMDTALIVGNTFCNVLGGPAIIDGGSDYFLVKDNYIGTDTLSRNLGNYGGIQLLSIDGSVKGSYYKQGKKENKIIKDNTFAYNENYGVLVDSMLVKAIIYNNRFIHTKNKAIIYRPEDHGKTAPSFVAKVENGQILINGLGNPGAYAEIYKSSAEKQTAIDFLKSAKIDPDGLFSISIPLSVFKDKNLCISAKQTLYDDKEEGATSELSDPTCLCYPDTIQVKDTIIVGTSFLGSKYTAGKHDSIFEYLKAKNGCDSIVMHTILVKPDPTIKEYYVKTTGKGNGTTWTDAMNGEDFALYFSLVDDDVTFHIAKGEYRPIYLNPEQSRENKKYTAYYTDKRVNLVGGYTSDPLEGEMPNPKLNATTFLGELEDNTIVYNIFVMKPQSQGTVTLQGIQLRKSAGSPNADDGMLFFEPQQKGVDILLERCTFQDASTAFRLTNSTGNISECMFSGNSGCTFIYNCSDVDINKCTFSQNSSVLSAFTDGSVSMTNSTIVGNSLINFSKINQTSNNDLQLRNNTFTGNFFGSINSVKYQLVGNIFAGNVNLVDTENVNSKYNLYLKGETAKDFLSATDIEAEAADFEYLLGDELEDHGGFTKTILLKDDQMMNGTTIRLPKSIAALSEDQRTVKRLDYTCIGSFEIPCMRDTTILEDHVYVGTSYSFSDELDGILTEVGDFEYTKKLKNVAGCDSLVKLLLTVECNDLETNINKAIKSGESYSFATLFKDRVFVKSGTYTFTDKLKSVYGCDSIVSLTLSVGCDAVEVNKESTAKVGEPFTYAGVCKDTVFTTAGEKTIKRTYTAVSGCDSVVILTVNVECPTIEKSIKESIKSGESYSFATLFKDRVFVKSGTYTFTDKMKSVYGCDSIVNLTLSVGCDAIEVNKESTAKVGEPFTYAGVCKDTVFTTAGEKTIKRTYTAASGCDSVVNLTVNVECPTIEKSIKENIKSGESYSFATLFKDRVFVKSGTYTFTDKMKSVYGCDSIVNLTLSVGCDAIEVNKESTANVGEPFTYAGVCKDTVFTTSGEKTIKRTYAAVSGCDSVVVLTVNVECPKIEKSIKESIKSGESYSFATLFKDRVFVKSGTYTFTDKMKSVYGCDSIVNLTLSVGCEAVEVETESTAKVGEPFTYAGICKDTVFTTIGEHTVKRTYTAVSGCDSIVTLTVNVDCPTIEKEVKASIQSGESYSFATLFADRVFVKSGTYQFTDKLKSVYGCDSVVNLTLSVGCEPKENEKILEAYIGVPFSYDNICKDTLFANVGTKIIEKAFLMASGCDSIVRLIVKVENRDSFYYKEKDAICEGLDYISDNWNLNVSDSLPSIYEFTQELGNSAKTDTFRVLNLHIIKNDHAIIEELRETPTICVGGRYGSVDFVLDRNLTTTLSVQLFDSRNSLVKSEKTQNQSDYIAFNGIASGDYSIKIAKISDDQCFSDTTFSIKIEEADPITIVGVDTIYTGCISEPTAHCELEVTGYHASVSLKMNERAVQRYKYRDRNCYVVQDNYDPTKATIHIDSLAEGVYLFDAYDYCGNEYKGIHKLVVKGPKPLKIEKIKGHTELACNRSDDGSVMLRLTGGSLLSRLNMQKNSGDEVYPMTGDTTIVELKDLEGGVYPLTYSSGIDNCSDHVSMDIEIKAPKPLKADLMVNGIVCQDAVITAYTSGENGEYSYRWVKPNGDTISTSDNHLSNVGAGRYECIVEDKGGCSKISSFAMVSPIESLSPLKLISVSVDETCYASDNAKIGVLYYNNNAHQAVTCSLENAETGEEIKSMTSMLYWGSFVLEDVAPGTYKIRLRYGTRNCNLSLDEVTKILEVKAKQKPLIIAEPIVTDATCYSIPNGTIELNVSGWEGNYKGRLDGKEVNPISVSKDSVAKFVFQSLKGGKYRFDVEDECKEQESSIDINVNQIKPYTLTYIDGADKLECAHDNTGYVRFKVEGGYYGHNNLYSANGDWSKVIGKDTTVVYSGLKKGAYLVVYESEVEGCPDKAILEYEVQAPEPLAMDLQLNGVNCPNGGLVAKTSGERRPYIYEWSTESSIRRTLSSRCPFVLEYGKTYQCKVRDLHGCDSVIRKVTIPSPDELPTLAVKGVGHTESCYRGNNGCITMQVSSERRIPYGVVVSCAFAPIGGTYTEKTSTMGNNWSLSSEKNLAPGKYSVRVHYGAAGCDMGLPSVYDTVEVIALQPVEIASDMQVKDVTCLKEPNGRISFEVNGWSETHKASLNQLSFQTINLFLFSINMPVFTVKEIRPVSVEGQKAIFELSNLESGTYFISVTDKCGNSSDNKSFGIRNAINPFRINVLSMEDELRCNYSKEGMVKLQLTGGNPDANVFYQEGEASISIKKDTVMVFSELGAGKYRFHFLSTEEGCSDHVSYEMNVSPANEFKQHLSLEGEPCKDQKLEAIIEGGAEPYKVTWKTENGVTVEIDEAGKYELTSAGTGSFYCETVDQKGCRYNSDTVKAVLIDSENMMLAIDTLIMEPTKCYSSEDGLIKVAISGNTAMSKIEARLFFGSELKQAIESNAEKDTLIFKDLGYGKYDVSLVYAEAEDCSLSNKAQGSILVESPTNLKITMNHVPVACDVDHGGKAIAMIEGGMAPYTIEWRNEIDEEHGLHQTRDIDTLKGLALDSSYYCVVKDSNECEQISGKVRITKMNLEDLLIDKFAYTKTVLCSGQNNARVTVSLRSRDERVPVKVSVRNESGIQNSVVIAENEMDGVVDGIAPGDYVVDIAYDDADACSSVFDSAITISPLEPLALSNIEMTHQVTCHNPANGGLKFDVSGWAETHVAAVVTKGDTLYLMPKSVEGQLAHFEESSLLGGDYVFVKDFCGDKREGITDLQTFEDYKVEVVAEKLKLRCNYSTDGFVEVKIEKGSHKNNKLYLVKKNGGNWELASDVVYDLDLEEPMQKRYSDLSAGTYRIIYQSNEEGCQDNAYQERTVEVPAPIRFIQAVKPAACSDVASGEFAITPYRYMADVKYVKLDDSENMALEVVDKKTAEYKVFPGIVDMNFYMLENGEFIDATAKLDTFMYSGGGSEEDAEPTRVEIANPYKGMWEWKDGDWTCPKYWIGFESLPSSIFCLKVTDDSACVFVDTLKVNDPKYGELKIEEVKFDADFASCHADHRYMEIYVKGGWGKYAYIVDPLNVDDVDDDFLSQTYESGDSTWAENGKGYYRTPILDPGIYKIAVVDSFGCKDSLQKTIEVKAKINVAGDVMADPCGGSESTITVHPSVVSSYAVYEPYSYAVRREDRTIGEKVQGSYREKVLGSIPKGTIGVYVYDDNGCSGYATFNVNGTDTSFVPMTAYSMKTLPVKCYGSEEGEIVFRAYGAFPPYKAFYMDDEREPMDIARLVFAEIDENLEKTGVTYHLDETGLDPTKKDTFCLTNLKGGKHTLTIVDSKNCKQKMEYVIKEPSALVVNSLKASPVCPNSTEGKISVKVSGGTAPYEYGFIEGETVTYQENEFLSAPQGVAKRISVKDANGCIIETGAATVNGTFDTDNVDQTCIVSTWQDFDDVLVFIDNSVVKEQYDSSKFVLDETYFIKGVTYKENNPIFYTYGIPDTIESIKLWNGEELKGPMWGIPSDIVAGVKDQAHYQEEQRRIKASMDAYNVDLKEYNASNNKSKNDSIRLADTYALIMQQWRANCTENMIKSTFKPLVSPSMTERMTFIQFSSSVDLQELMKPSSSKDSVLFEYGFKHILYVAGCDLTTEHQSIKIAKEGIKPYGSLMQRDIIAVYASPNPVDANQNFTMTVKFSSKVDFEVQAYNMLGISVSEEPLEFTADDVVWTEESENDNMVYVAKCEMKLPSTSVVVIKTYKDQASTTVVVTGAANSGN